MQAFWLAIGCILLIVITYLVITEGFNKWGGYYIMAVMCFLVYLVRRWMMKRMKKHQVWMQEQQENNK